MKAYYGSRISPNMTETPEGFLICHNVPIARTGWQEYLGREIGLNDKADDVIQVYRSPEQVFAPATMASFEGKSTTDEHPSNDVRPDNYASLEKGQVTNVRQGSGENSDLLIADLIIKDSVLISEIENGVKREVSCGYECTYEPLEDGKYQQISIRGNHVAVVKNGRAGDRVAIKDQKPKQVERSKRMPNLDPKSLWAKMLSAFAKDAEPEELAEAAKMGPKEETVKDNLPPVTPGGTEPPKKTGDEPPAPASAENPAIAALSKQIEALTGIVNQLVESDKAVHAKLDAQNQKPEGLDALEIELEQSKPGENAVNEEESVTIPPEQITDADPGPVAPNEERPDNPVPGADRNTILTAIKAIKPHIAEIKDPAERKKVSDALAKTFRDQIAGAATARKGNGYADIQKALQDNAKKNTQDKAATKTDDTDLGKEWAKKHNPHYKNKEGK